MDCIFCSIISDKIPVNKVYEDEYVLAFTDINPLASIHIIVIPKQCRSHFHNIDDDTIIYLCKAIKTIVKEQNLTENGYRLINNNGSHGGQTVNHAHIHILAGEYLGHNLAGK